LDKPVPSAEDWAAFLAEQKGAPDENAPPPDGGRARRPPRFSLVKFSKIQPLDGDDDYCVKNLLPRSGLVVVWGAPKCGKSFWTFDLLMHVALGWTYRGLRVRQGPVTYICLEGTRGFRKRKTAFENANLTGGEDPPFYLISDPLALVKDVKTLIGDIKQQAGEDIPSIVCIDTLNRSLVGSENNDQDMAAYVRAADAIRDAFDCLVVIVHHCGHEAQRPRGHSSLIGALDVQIAVSRDTEGNIVSQLELAKDGEPGLVFVSRLENVEIGRDRDGDPVASCVIREVANADSKPPAKKPGKSQRSDDVAKVKRALAEAYGRLADTADKTPGFDAKPVRKVETSKLRDEVKSRGFLEIDDDGNLTSAARQHFQRAKTDLIASKSFIEADGKFWKLEKEGDDARTPRHDN
jgi:AAA domain